MTHLQLIPLAARSALVPALAWALASPAWAQSGANGASLRSPALQLGGDMCLSSDCSRVLQFRVGEFSNSSDGSRIGELVVSLVNDTGLELQLSCIGPRFLGYLQVQRRQFSSTMNAVIDPTTPGCSSFNVSGPLAINLVAQLSSGGSATSTVGTSTTTSPTGTVKQSFAIDSWDSTATGTIGNLSVTLQGASLVRRLNEITPGRK